MIAAEASFLLVSAALLWSPPERANASLLKGTDTFLSACNEAPSLIAVCPRPAEGSKRRDDGYATAEASFYGHPVALVTHPASAFHVFFEEAHGLSCLRCVDRPFPGTDFRTFGNVFTPEL